MTRDMVQRFHGFVHPVFWPVLWLSLITYQQRRAALRAQGYGTLLIAVSRWGWIVITFAEPPLAPEPGWQRHLNACNRDWARRRTNLAGGTPVALVDLSAALRLAAAAFAAAPSRGFPPRPAICDSS